MSAAAKQFLAGNRIRRARTVPFMQNNAHRVKIVARKGNYVCRTKIRPSLTENSVREGRSVFKRQRDFTV